MQKAIRTLVRNFYGHQRVIEYDVGSDNEHRALIHGTITHGIQFMPPKNAPGQPRILLRNPGSGLPYLYLDLPQVIDKAGKTLGKHTLVVLNHEDETKKIY